MNNVVATLLGVGICCIIPLATFFAGVYYARYGLPVAVQWRGFARHEHEDDLSD